MVTGEFLERMAKVITMVLNEEGYEVTLSYPGDYKEGKFTFKVTTQNYNGYVLIDGISVTQYELPEVSYVDDLGMARASNTKLKMLIQNIIYQY